MWKNLKNTHSLTHTHTQTHIQDFPDGLAVKNLPVNAGDRGSIPDLGRFHMPWGR